MNPLRQFSAPTGNAEIINLNGATVTGSGDGIHYGPIIYPPGGVGTCWDINLKRNRIFINPGPATMSATLGWDGNGAPFGNSGVGLNFYDINGHVILSGSSLSSPPLAIGLASFGMEASGAFLSFSSNWSASNDIFSAADPGWWEPQPTANGLPTYPASARLWFYLTPETDENSSPASSGSVTITYPYLMVMQICAGSF